MGLRELISQAAALLTLMIPKKVFHFRLFQQTNCVQWATVNTYRWCAILYYVGCQINWFGLSRSVGFVRFSPRVCITPAHQRILASDHGRNVRPGNAIIRQKQISSDINRKSIPFHGCKPASTTNESKYKIIHSLRKNEKRDNIPTVLQYTTYIYICLAHISFINLIT